MTAKAQIQPIEEQLYLVSLSVPIDGFDGFIGAWVHTGNPVVVVDVGPAVAAPQLLSAVAELGCSSPDLILLTHIHIDHAGAIGMVGRTFPHATVVCHPKGAEHLIEPDRLWQGSLKTLGDIAKAYGPIAPLNARQLFPEDRPIHSGIAYIDTPGHAAHHYSYLLGDILFAGEAGGVNLPLEDDNTYLRPATPPRFFLDTSLDSIDKLLAASPDRICYGHVGQRQRAMELLGTHREQLMQWRELITPFVEDDSREENQAQQACRDHLLSVDPLLAGFSSLPPQVQERELGFLSNSIKGYWGFIQSSSR